MKHIITVLALISGHTLLAQDQNIAGVNYAYNKADYDAQQANAFVKFPLTTNLGGILSYHHLHVYHHTFQSIATQLFYKYQSWALIGTVGLYEQGWRYGLGCRYLYKYSDHLRTGIGLMYNRQFFGNQLIPFLDVNFEPDPHWTLSGIFPIRPKIMYHFDKKISAGVEVMGEANSYMMEAYYMRNNQWTGLLKFEWIFSRYLQLNVGVGKNMINRYQLFEKNAKIDWTIITIPVGERIVPVQEVDVKGLNATMGLMLRLNRN